MIGELLRARGERSVPRNPTLLAERAFHTTSDFPALLSAAANKMLLAAYQPAQPSYRQIFLRRDFRDFKPHRHLRIGDFPVLQPLLENGEIQSGTMSESQEIVLLQTFARRIRVTRQMLVNDDLGAFTDFAAMIGRRVADFENATAYALVNLANGDGPTLTTGNAAVFGTGAARANKAAAGTAQEASQGLDRGAARRRPVLRGPAIDGRRRLRHGTWCAVHAACPATTRGSSIAPMSGVCDGGNAPRRAASRTMPTSESSSPSSSPRAPSRARTGSGSIARQAGSEASRLDSSTPPRSIQTT
jgi:hypothetical protein